MRITFLNREHYHKNLPLTLNNTLRINRVGYDYGLTVVVNQMVEDYAYTYHNFIGLNVFLMEPTHFLDDTTGSSVMRISQVDEELYLSLNAVPIVASQNIRMYSPSLRGCLFDNENMLGKYVKNLRKIPEDE